MHEARDAVQHRGPSRIGHGTSSAPERIRTIVVEDHEQIAQLVANRIATLIRERQAAGQRAVLGLATGSTPIGVYLELSRKERTDPEIRRLHREQAENELAPALIEHVRAAQAAGDFRADLPPEKIAGFVSLVANGIAMQLGSGEPIRDVDTLLEFVRTAVGPPT